MAERPVSQLSRAAALELLCPLDDRRVFLPVSCYPGFPDFTPYRFEVTGEGHLQAMHYSNGVPVFEEFDLDHTVFETWEECGTLDFLNRVSIVDKLKGRALNIRVYEKATIRH